MFRKYMIITALLMPMAAQAQQLPMDAPQPQPVAACGPGDMGVLVPLALLVVVAAVLAHPH